MLRTKDIALITDDNYCLPTAVCIQSIIDHYAGSESITIHVCTFGLSVSNVAWLVELSREHVSVVVDNFNSGGFEDRIQQISQKSHVTPTALIKFELPNYFHHTDTLLYLDGDIIVKKDLQELLFLDVSQQYLAASYEFWKLVGAKMYSFGILKEKGMYFNSGVMLLNLKKMREDGITEKLWDYKLNKAKTKLMDQESLNAVCNKNIISLAIKWNFNPNFLNKNYLRDINKTYNTQYADVEEMVDDVCIIHYVGTTDKPWNYKTASMRSFWDKSFKNVGYIGELSLKDVQAEKRGRFASISWVIKNTGLLGFVSFVLYNIKNR